MANYCRKCGNVLLEDSQFCENCGTRVGAQAQPQPQSQSPSQPDPFANTQGGYYPQQPTYTNQGSNRPSVKGRVFGIVSLASAISGVVYILMITLMMFTMGIAYNSFFNSVIVIWLIIGLLIEGVALGFGIAADKCGNTSQMCRIARIITIIGLALFVIVLIIFIIVANSSSNRVDNMFDAIMDSDYLEDYYDSVFDNYYY